MKIILSDIVCYFSVCAPNSFTIGLCHWKHSSESQQIAINILVVDMKCRKKMQVKMVFSRQFPPEFHKQIEATEIHTYSTNVDGALAEFAHSRDDNTRWALLFAHHQRFDRSTDGRTSRSLSYVYTGSDASGRCSNAVFDERIYSSFCFLLALCSLQQAPSSSPTMMMTARNYLLPSHKCRPFKIKIQLSHEKWINWWMMEVLLPFFHSIKHIICILWARVMIPACAHTHTQTYIHCVYRKKAIRKKCTKTKTTKSTVNSNFPHRFQQNWIIYQWIIIFVVVLLTFVHIRSRRSSMQMVWDFVVVALLLCLTLSLPRCQLSYVFCFCSI